MIRLSALIRAFAVSAGVFTLAALFYLSLGQAALLAGVAGVAALGLELAGNKKKT